MFWHLCGLSVLIKVDSQFIFAAIYVDSGGPTVQQGRRVFHSQPRVSSLSHHLCGRGQQCEQFVRAQWVGIT